MARSHRASRGQNSDPACRRPPRRDERLRGEWHGDVRGRIEAALGHAVVLARGDADDGERMAVDADGPAEDRGIAAEGAPPHSEAEDGDWRRAVSLVLLVDTASELHRHAHPAEVVARHEHPAAHDRLAFERDVGLAHEGQRKEIGTIGDGVPRSAV